jgi:hypothetical protein
MKLNQVIALVQGKKARANKALTDVHHGWKPDALMGLSKTYKPLDEDGEKFPSEKKQVPLLLWEVIRKLRQNLIDYYDVVGTQESTNQMAVADIKVGGTILLAKVPVTVLLFFEKQVTDLLTFAKNLPVLPMDKAWVFDTTKNCFITEPEQTTKTQKRPEVIVKYQATKEHPAQTEMFSVDKTIGHWTTTYMSGCIPAQKREEIVERLEKLQDAVKSAREEANNIEVKSMVNYGGTLFDYIFGNESLTS